VDTEHVFVMSVFVGSWRVSEVLLKQSASATTINLLWVQLASEKTENYKQSRESRPFYSCGSRERQHEDRGLTHKDCDRSFVLWSKPL
jgi:hypothetical protein